MAEAAEAATTLTGGASPVATAEATTITTAEESVSPSEPASTMRTSTSIVKPSTTTTGQITGNVGTGNGTGTGKSTSSVYERLYKKTTESGRIRTKTPKPPTVPRSVLSLRQDNKPVVHKKKKMTTNKVGVSGRTKHSSSTSSSTSTQSSSIYERLYNKGTVTSNRKVKNGSCCHDENA